MKETEVATSPTNCNTKQRNMDQESGPSGTQDSSNRQRSKGEAGRPTKRWEDDLNDFVKDKATEVTQSNDLKNDTTWLAAAINTDDWKKTARQYVKLTINGLKVPFP